jgi:hypothetical protein
MDSSWRVNKLSTRTLYWPDADHKTVPSLLVRALAMNSTREAAADPAGDEMVLTQFNSAGHLYYLGTTSASLLVLARRQST